MANSASTLTSTDKAQPQSEGCKDSSASGSRFEIDSGNGSPRDPLSATAKETAATMSANAKEAMASLSASAKETAKSTARAAKEQASAFASEVGHELHETAEGQKARGAEVIGGFACAIESAAAELEGQSPQVAKYVHDAAGNVKAFSENIGNRDVNELARAATELARSQPVLFIGGAVAAGFMLSRFLKSTAHSASPAQNESSNPS
jgi:hypothetical protein